MSDTSPEILGDPRWFAWKVEEAKRSRRFRRLSRRLDTIPLSNRDRETLRAILLVESTARPPAFRALEWTALVVGRILFLPRALLPKTRGPFQMADAPFSFEEAAISAAQRLKTEHRDPEHLARFWHGTAGRERGARVGYAAALALVMRKLT